MRKILILFIIMFSFFSKNLSAYEKLAYDFSFINIKEGLINLKDYRGKTLIIVNVASRCGFTNQYDDLQRLWSNYKNKGVVVIGIPSNNFKQEPGSNKEIRKFCESTFGVDFPVAEKTNIIGKNAHPFFKWAKKNYGIAAVPKWNFHKIIINKNGKISNTFTSITKPYSKKFINFIEKEIKS
tara:strand:+ start:810 stop:1355 length:546 start_codon:yes stop_codon:yes gene_type:complete